jgi:hypothetical protein
MTTFFNTITGIIENICYKIVENLMKTKYNLKSTMQSENSWNHTLFLFNLQHSIW